LFTTTYCIIAGINHNSKVEFQPPARSAGLTLTGRAAFAYIAAPPSGAARPNVFSKDEAPRPMSRRCELTGVGPMVGHNVSHSNIKTKRRFLPALSPASLASESLGQTFRLRVSNAALRTVDFRGGLDAFLVKAKDETLSPRALKIKKQVKTRLAAQPAG